MQVIHQNEVKGRVSRRTSAVDFVICTRGSSGCVERKHNRRAGSRKNRI